MTSLPRRMSAPADLPSRAQVSAGGHLVNFNPSDAHVIKGKRNPIGKQFFSPPVCAGGALALNFRTADGVTVRP